MSVRCTFIVLLLVLTSLLANAAATVSVEAVPAAEPGPGVFLVADESMPDPRFRHAVLLLLEHSDEGTVGVMVNRPTELSLAAVRDDLQQFASPEHRLNWGGPVAPEAIVVLFRENVQAVPEAERRHVFADLYWSAREPHLNAILAQQQAPETVRLYMGYAGWAPDQLDAELVGGSWLLFRARPEVVFHEQPESLWESFTSSARRTLVRNHSLPAAPKSDGAMLVPPI